MVVMKLQQRKVKPSYRKSKFPTLMHMHIKLIESNISWSLWSSILEGMLEHSQNVTDWPLPSPTGVWNWAGGVSPTSCEDEQCVLPCSVPSPEEWECSEVSHLTHTAPQPLGQPALVLQLVGPLRNPEALAGSCVAITRVLSMRLVGRLQTDT